MEPLRFSEAEIAYLRGQRLARIATARPETNQPDVAPVGFLFEDGRFHIGGMNLQKTYKYKNARGNPLVALVVDDLASVDPWRPRGIKIHGRAAIDDVGGREMITITAVRKWSWGIETT